MVIKEIFYDWGGYNEKIFYLINNIHGELYDKFMLLGTGLGYYKMYPFYVAIILMVAGFDLCRKRNVSKDVYLICREKWAKVVSTLLLAQGFSFIWVGPLKSYFHFPRPFVSLPEGSVIISEAIRLSESPMASFPSGHSSFAMTMAASIWPALNLPGKIIACFYVLWVGVSRMSLGVHFPADVVISFITAFAAVYIIRVMLDKVWVLIKKRFYTKPI